MSRRSYPVMTPYPMFIPMVGGDSGNDGTLAVMVAILGGCIVASWRYIITPRFNKRLNLRGNIIKIQYKKVNGHIDVRLLTHQNLESLRLLGYMIDSKPKEGSECERWKTVAVVTKEGLSVDQFYHACKAHGVHTIIDYEFEGALTSIDYQRKKKFAWGSCKVRDELA